MDAEAITTSAAPPVRTSPPRPSGEQASPVSSGESGKVEVAPQGDTVTLSSQGSAGQQTPVKVSPEKTSGGGSSSSQTRLEVTDKNEIVLQILDPKTGQVIKEIPAREQQRLSHAIQDTVDKLSNNGKK